MFVFSKYVIGTSLQYHIVSDLPTIPCAKSNSRISQFWTQYKKPIFVMLYVAIQFLLSSLLWNYFMFKYHVLLETDKFAGEQNLQSVRVTQNEILKSSSMWMVSYFWRLVNPQTMTQAEMTRGIMGGNYQFNCKFAFRFMAGYSMR